MDEVNLLYVDKSKVSRNLLAKGLDVIANVTGVESIAEARAAIDAGTFNFFILDYELPDGDGLTLAKELRQNPSYAKTPIILYTASLNNDLEFRAMQAGVNEGLAKPINMLDMMQHVVRQIELPSIKHVRRQLLQLTCFSWIADGKHFEYSPDLGLLLSGDDKQALQQMNSALEEQIFEREDPSKYPADIEVYKHIINLSTRGNEAA